MAAQKVAPGGWVQVRLPTDAWPVTMSIGDEPPKPAFIDHIAGRREVETWAKRRCPQLRPGRYTVRVHAGGQLVETQVTVV